MIGAANGRGLVSALPQRGKNAAEDSIDGSQKLAPTIAGLLSSGSTIRAQVYRGNLQFVPPLETHGHAYPIAAILMHWIERASIQELASAPNQLLSVRPCSMRATGYEQRRRRDADPTAKFAKSAQHETARLADFLHQQEKPALIKTPTVAIDDAERPEELVERTSDILRRRGVAQLRSRNAMDGFGARTPFHALAPTDRGPDERRPDGDEARMIRIIKRHPDFDWVALEARCLEIDRRDHSDLSSSRRHGSGCRLAA